MGEFTLDKSTPNLNSKLNRYLNVEAVTVKMLYRNDESSLSPGPLCQIFINPGLKLCTTKAM